LLLFLWHTQDTVFAAIFLTALITVSMFVSFISESMHVHVLHSCSQRFPTSNPPNLATTPTCADPRMICAFRLVAIKIENLVPAEMRVQHLCAEGQTEKNGHFEAHSFAQQNWSSSNVFLHKCQRAL